MLMAMETVDALSQSSDSEVAAAATTLRDSQDYKVNVFLNRPIVGANALTGQGTSRESLSKGPLGVSYVMMNPESRITGTKSGEAGWRDDGSWGWLKINANFSSTFAHELGHAAYNMMQWGKGDYSEADSGRWAVRFHNAYALNPSAVPPVPWRFIQKEKAHF
jgi:hypothetical protein